MKQIFCINSNFLKIIIILSHIFYTELSESKRSLLNDIIIFENTDGGIYLAKDYLDSVFIFGTSLSNEEDRIFYGLTTTEEKYIFKDKGELIPFIKKNINRTENKKILNAKMGLFSYGTDNFIILIGTDDSYIEVLSVNHYQKGLNSYSASDFFPQNTINKGISPTLYSYMENLTFISSSKYNDNSTNCFISANKFGIDIKNFSIFTYTLDYNRSFYNIKGEYINCFEFSLNFFSCFYLDIDNNYKINIIENTKTDFIERNSTIVGTISSPIDGEFPFLKGIPVTDEDNFYAIYAYYSGDSNDIPTFLFINCDKTDYIFSNKYNDKYPVVYLYDYPFNNGINYNDIVLYQFYKKYEDFFFVSTNKDKEYLIIAYLIFFTSSSSSSDIKLSIRYYLIQLKEYFNMNIFHGFKIINFNNFLTLGFDFCITGQCESSNNGNAALMIFSYLNKTKDININFTEYAFTNNRKYIVSNLSEIFSISNNIFGYVFIEEFELGIDYYLYDEENGIDFYYGIDNKPLEDIYPPIGDDALLRIDFNTYNFDDHLYNEILFPINAVILPEEDLTTFNSYCDNYNDSFGDINDENSYQFDSLISVDATYNINMEDELSSLCNATNCSLCLKNDSYYCIICIDDNYTIIFDQIYGKRKICEIKQNEDFSSIPTNDLTEQFTEIETTIIDTTIIDITNIDTTIVDTTIIDTTIIDNTNIDTTIVDTTNVDTTNVDTTIIDTTNVDSTIIDTTNADTTFVGSSIANTELFYTSNYYMDSLDITNEISQLKNLINFDDLLNDKYKDINLSNEEIKYIYGEIQSYLAEKYNGENTIINTKNVKIQIAKMDEQKNNQELSNIDLGECGDKLKLKYCKAENDSLIILKFDFVPENEKSTFVGFEVYEPNNLSKIDLNECEKSKIVMNIPIELDHEIEEIYNLLSKSGYNLFNDQNKFYNDICATYTTENGTDILLYDRRNDIYQLTVNISLCQEGCEFESYFSNTKKAKCNCRINSNKNEINNFDLSNIQFNKNEMLDRFKEVIDNSNFRVLKCYKLVFKFNLFIKNIGSIIMTILFILFLILLVIYKLLSSKRIHFLIQDIINYKKEKFNQNKINSVDKNLIEEKLNKKKKKNKKKNKKSNKSLKLKENINHDKNNIINPLELKNAPPKKSKKYISENNLEGLTNSKNIINKSNNDYNNYESNYSLKKKNKKRKKRTIINKNNKENNIDIYNKNKYAIINKEKNESKENYEKKRNTLSNNDKNSEKKLNTEEKNQMSKINELNDQEINSLEYEKAIELDKRTFFQYYLSLIKKKQLILFTFLPSKDYNLISLKISLFLVSFSLYLSINAFFFNDDTMHKIYKDNGAYNILYQIPQILYSSITSSVINILLKNLSLSEKDILKIKEEKDPDNFLKKSNQTEKCIKIKFIIFYIISILLMIFFWYFISCFCVVYTNTQIILFKDTLISFALSMLYPFGLNLLPGFFRIPSLRAKNKDKKCLYSISQILALL